MDAHSELKYIETHLQTMLNVKDFRFRARGITAMSKRLERLANHAAATEDASLAARVVAKAERLKMLFETTDMIARGTEPDALAGEQS